MEDGMNIDTLLRELHEDRARVVDDQLGSLEREITKRRLLSAEAVVMLFGHIGDLRERILALQPEHQNAPDPHRKERMELERECRDRECDLEEERLNRWRDEQALRREQRERLREGQEERQRYERHSGNYEA
jgi:hypothetical protein